MGCAAPDPYRAVIFDVGGVIVRSPLEAIARYEREHSIPDGFVNRVVVASGPAGAWARLECGELSLEGFYGAFEAECAAAGQALRARELLGCIAAFAEPHAEMIAAIGRIRERGLGTAALTNNWPEEGERTAALRAHFDVFVESRLEGLRKPDPRIYRLACERLAVAPAQAIFLDDIGRNLKAARELGMATIRVTQPGPALAELGRLLGFSLRAEGPEAFAPPRG